MLSRDPRAHDTNDLDATLILQQQKTIEEISPSLSQPMAPVRPLSLVKLREMNYEALVTTLPIWELVSSTLVCKHLLECANSALGSEEEVRLPLAVCEYIDPGTVDTISNETWLVRMWTVRNEHHGQRMPWLWGCKVRILPDHKSSGSIDRLRETCWTGLRERTWAYADSEYSDF